MTRRRCREHPRIRTYGGPTSVNLRPNTRHIPRRHTDTTPHYFPRGDTALHFEVCKCGVAGPRAKVDTCGPPYRGLSHAVALHQCNDTSVIPEASENAPVHRSLDCIVLHVTTVMLAPRVGDSALTSRDNVTPLHNVAPPRAPFAVTDLLIIRWHPSNSAKREASPPQPAFASRCTTGRPPPIFCFFGTDSTDSPDCLPILLPSVSDFYFLVLLFLHF